MLESALRDAANPDESPKTTSQIARDSELRDLPRAIGRQLLQGQERYTFAYTLEGKWTPCLNAPTPTVLNFAQPGWKAKRYAFNLKKFAPQLPSMRIIVLKFE